MDIGIRRLENHLWFSSPPECPLPCRTSSIDGRPGSFVACAEMVDALEALPVSPGLDVGALSRLFDDSTNSYKRLFFAALLAEFKASDFKICKFTISNLTIGMLAAAWYPVRYYQLSLGVRDKVDEILRGPELAFDRPL